MFIYHISRKEREFSSEGIHGLFYVKKRISPRLLFMFHVFMAASFLSGTPAFAEGVEVSVTASPEAYAMADGKMFDLAAMQPSTDVVASLAPMLPVQSLSTTAAAEAADLAAQAAHDLASAPADPPPLLSATDRSPTTVEINRSREEAGGQRRFLARMEVAFQLLNVGDAATTIACVQSADCHEKNPLYGGSHPSWGRVAGIKAGVGLMHYLIYRLLLKEDSHAAKFFEISSVAIQGSVFVWNMTVMLK